MGLGVPSRGRSQSPLIRGSNSVKTLGNSDHRYVEFVGSGELLDERLYRIFMAGISGCTQDHKTMAHVLPGSVKHSVLEEPESHEFSAD